jgi:serine phosphatase RsbU (regulator of sigma subunit)
VGSVLLAAGEQVSADLAARLTKLGFTVLPAKDVQVVMDLCEHALPDMAVLGDLDDAQALADAHPRVPLVLATERALEADELLRALQIGVCDVWLLPLHSEDLAERLARVRDRRAAAASDAERRLSSFVSDLERDQRAGRYIQMGMLPPNPMAIDGFRFQHHILPSLLLSGDFVDYFRITDRHFAFYVADVSGHGASSAFVTVLLKNFSRRLRREFRPSMLNEPGEILAWINRELLEQHIDKYVSLILGVGDYPPAILCSGAGSVFLEQKGKPVGLFDEVGYEALTASMNVGDRLVIFSDGVMDAMGPGELAEKERRLLEAAAAGSTVDEIWRALGTEFDADHRPDDMTCLVVQRET